MLQFINLAAPMEQWLEQGFEWVFPIYARSESSGFVIHQS
uniref:Uncharacterized protein n=1 Tax=Rhizophora mucronata TaxID=61149 RepID=A0A2P2J362_RHIMU